MPRRFEMSVLRQRCQRRADREGDDHISDAEWNALISEVYGELYAIVAGAGLRYFETVEVVTATGAASYDEPDDHLGTVTVCRVTDASGHRVDLTEIMAQEQSAYAGRTGTATHFALVDDQLVLYPAPASGTYEVRYVPQPPDLSSYADADIVDVVTPAGESFLIWGVAVIAHAKTESDAQLASQRRDVAEAKLTEWAINRAIHSTRRRVVEDDYPSDLDAQDFRR